MQGKQPVYNMYSRKFNCEQVHFYFVYALKLVHNVLNLHAPPNFCQAHALPVGTTGLKSST